MADAEFQKRRVVCVLGERDAPASFTVEGVLVVKIGEEEITKPHTRPATAEEVRQIFGDGHTQQLANIDMLTGRMAELQEEARAHQVRAENLDQRLKALVELDKEYDRAAAGIKEPKPAQ